MFLLMYHFSAFFRQLVGPGSRGIYVGGLRVTYPHLTKIHELRTVVLQIFHPHVTRHLSVKLSPILSSTKHGGLSSECEHIAHNGSRCWAN